MTEFGPASAVGLQYKGNPVSGTVTSKFGTHSEWRKSRGMGWHTGVDIAADRWTPLLSPADGTFVWSGWTSGGLGYVTILDHGDIGTLYAHQPAPFAGLSRGDPVKRGDRIGAVGNTGNSSGPHVHWMASKKKSGTYWDFTRDGGGLLDPLSMLVSATPVEPDPQPLPRWLQMAAYAIPSIVRRKSRWVRTEPVSEGYVDDVYEVAVRRQV